MKWTRIGERKSSQKTQPRGLGSDITEWKLVSFLLSFVISLLFCFSSIYPLPGLHLSVCWSEADRGQHQTEEEETPKGGHWLLHGGADI